MALFASGAGCAFFYRQPALPRPAAIESRETPRADEQFAALVQNADIIYFPTELLGPSVRSEPSMKLVDALQRGGNSFTIGCDLIGGDEQALLDLWARDQLSTENLISRLHLSGPARERENCRALLHGTQAPGVRFLALRCPPELLAAARPEAADARGFDPPAGDFQKFAERFAGHGMTENGLRAAYAAALLAEEFAAGRIAGHFREHRDEKLLAFVHRRHLEGARGVPYFVAQKIKARQLVLDSQPDRSSRSQLLAWRRRDGDRRDGGRRDSGGRGRLAGRFEIIDRPPGASGHHP